MRQVECERNCPNWRPSPGHVRSCAQVPTERQGQRLPEWLVAVRQDDLPGLHTLAAGIDRDQAAVTAGLTLLWNSGVVEGHVNRIKMLKRQVFRPSRLRTPEDTSAPRTMT